MKVSSFLAPLLLSTSVGAAFFEQKTLLDDPDNKLKVPGDNPLTYCADPKNYTLSIDYVDLDPNPPQPGKNLTIKAVGTFEKDVEKGTKVHLQVKYGLITVVNTEADFCDRIEGVDLECPLKKGETEFKKDIEIPKQVPPGKYNVLADVYTKEGEKITCLEATVVFTRS